MFASMRSLLTLAASRSFAEARLAFAVHFSRQASRSELLWHRNADLAVIMLLIALPWSTSATSVLGVVAFLLMAPALRASSMMAILQQPAVVTPIALVLLAALGMLWANDIPWPERIGSVGKLIKFLLLPLLMLHVAGSRRVNWMLVSFAVSNGLLLIYSFVVAILPGLALVQRLNQPGVPVRNYIDQSQGFMLVAVALAGLACEASIQKRYHLSGVIWLTAGLFFANLAFVDIARTAFFYGPAMLILLIVRYAPRNMLLFGFVALAISIGSLWAFSPNLQQKVSSISRELLVSPDAPIGEQQPSAAVRLELWRKSVNFFKVAPLLGHGTGATRHLFEEDSVGKTGLSALVVSNPHNQTLAAALQWGVLGVVTVWAMWIAHVRLLYSCRTMAAWIGLLAVVQNIASSMFNSHLSDTYEGWLYVLAVGIGAGEKLRIERQVSNGPAELECAAQIATQEIKGD